MSNASQSINIKVCDKFQSFNHSIIQSFNHSIIQSFNHSIIQSFNHSIIQSFNYLIVEKINGQNKSADIKYKRAGIKKTLSFFKIEIFSNDN